MNGDFSQLNFTKVFLSWYNIKSTGEYVKKIVRLCSLRNCSLIGEIRQVYQIRSTNSVQTKKSGNALQGKYRRVAGHATPKYAAPVY